MNTKWYGTASLGIEADGKSILIDPFFNKNPRLPCADIEDFTQYDTIFLTHGHYDHLVDVPQILSHGNAHVYCTKTPAKTLRKMGVPASRIYVTEPGTTVSVNGFVVDIYHSKHVFFDVNTILKHAVSLDFYRHLPTALRLIISAVTMPEAGEIVGYHIHAAGDDMFVLGSMNCDSRVNYPKQVGTLVIPYNGCSSLEKTALSITELFEPRKVLLDHYDDSFPPITQLVETEGFVELMKTEHPEIPVECMKYTAGRTVDSEQHKTAAAASFA